MSSSWGYVSEELQNAAVEKNLAVPKSLCTQAEVGKEPFRKEDRRSEKLWRMLLTLLEEGAHHH